MPLKNFRRVPCDLLPADLELLEETCRKHNVERNVLVRASVTQFLHDKETNKKVLTKCNVNPQQSSSSLQRN